MDPETGETITDPVRKTEIFASQFAAASNVNTRHGPHREQSNGGLTDVIFTTNAISKIIIGLNTNKAYGPDGIFNKVIKLLYPFLTYILPILYQNSFDCSIFPSTWKKGIVSPIYKNKGDKRDPANSNSAFAEYLGVV